MVGLELTGALTRPGARWFGPPAVGMALVLVLGFHQLGEESLWADEGLSAFAVQRRWADLLSWSASERPTHGLYYLVLKAWTVFGSGEVGLRSLSVVCMAAAAALLAVLAAELFGHRAAIAAAIVFAVNPFVLHYAQEARVYALLVLLAVASSLLLVGALERPSALRWIGWGLCAAAMVYAQAAAGGMVLVVHVTAILLHPARSLRTTLPAGVVLTATLAPLAWLVGQAGTSGIDWIDPPGWGDVYPALRQLAGGADLLVAFLAAASISAVALTSKSLDRERARWGLQFAALLVAVPFVLSYLVSQVQPVFISKYLIVAILGITLLAAGGIAGMPRIWLASVTVALIVGASIPGVWRWYAEPQRQDWRGAAAIVSSRARSDDVVIFGPAGGRQAFIYYNRDHRTRRVARALQGDILAGRRRFWWALSATGERSKMAREARARFSLDYRERAEWRLFKVVVRLYSLKPSGKRRS